MSDQRLIVGAGGGGGKGGGGGGGTSRVPVEAPDSLRSRAFAQVVDLLCEGEIAGLVDGLKSVYLDETPVQSSDGTINFQGVTLVTRTGTQAQSYIPGFSASESEAAVGVEVTAATPIVRTVTNVNANAVRVRVAVPALVYQNPANGDTSGTSVQIAIDVQASGGGYVQQLVDTISGKTTSTYERVYRVQLTGSAPWNIRVRRLTPDSTTASLANKTRWESYTEIVESKLRYPNSALAALKIDSSQFNRIPSRGYDCKLLLIRIPTNATVRADGSLSYSGSWDGTFQVAWAADPAWCFYDLITNSRYGCGQSIPADLVDKWAIYRISQYCSELVPNGFGGTEPRFTCNIYIQNREEAYKVIQDMASIFRGMTYWGMGLVTAVQDAPSDPVMLYTPANVIDGQFNYQGSSLRTRHTVAVVSWNDPSDMYRAKAEYVEDAAAVAKYGVISTDVVAIGCTSRGQAHRVGRWLLYSEQLETETVTFRTGLDSALVRPGQIIQVADPVRAGKRMGGRILSATNTSVTVDAVPTIVLPAALWVMLPNGSVQSREVQAINGTTITVTSAFTEPPLPQLVWMLESVALNPQLFRVISLAESDGSQYEITALAHNPGKYGFIENGLTLESRNITVLNLIPEPPSAVTLTESLYRQQALVRSKISVSWPVVDGVNRYRVDWKKDGGNLTSATTQSTEYELLDTTPGVYTFRVYSLGANGQPSSSYAEGIIEALGKTAPPSDVTGLAAVLDPDIGVTLTWNPVADLDLQGYEIRRGTNWNTAAFVALVSATSYKVETIASGSATYLVRALDTSGIYSANTASVNRPINAPPAPTVTLAFNGPNVVLNWNAVSGSLSTARYEVRFGSSFAAGTSLGSVQATTFSTRANFSGSRLFWVAAIDTAGTTGAAGSATAAIQAPAAPTVSAQVVDNNILFRWNDVTATLPIDYYEIRKGAVYATAEVIGTKQGRFTSVFETASGSYTYWIVGVDAAGNYGTPGSVVAQVSQPPDYVLFYDQNSTFSGTRTNLLSTSAGTVANVNLTETWTTHFTSRGWNTPQDQINAGYPVYIMPSTATASYVETVDYGTTLTGTLVSATLSRQQVSGATTITPTVSLSTNGTTWTDYAGVESVFGPSFRYFRVRYDFASTGGDDVLLITGLKLKLDAKLKTDAGNGTANAADAGGTTVTFNQSFIDISSITVTPSGTTPVVAIYDFVDAPYPTSFKVLLFNTSGTRVSGAFSWTARGV